MNDVLPKPFTKESLLAMLEKHLAHLKKPMSGMEGMVPPQPQALNSARQSLKEEESPAKSPATGSNWNSPNQLPGVSPVNSTMTDEYMNSVSGHPGPYGVSPGMGGPSGMNQYGGPSQMHRPPQQQQQSQHGHRRQISDITGGGEEMVPASKRQQMYGGPFQPQGMNPMQRPR